MKLKLTDNQNHGTSTYIAGVIIFLALVPRLEFKMRMVEKRRKKKNSLEMYFYVRLIDGNITMRIPYIRNFACRRDFIAFALVYCFAVVLSRRKSLVQCMYALYNNG